jgi:ketosteroid isomerase-like protein
MIGALMAKRALAGAFDALNRHDLVRFMSTWRDDGVFVYPGDIPESGRFEGRNAVEGWFRRFFEQFPTIQFDVQDICVSHLFDLLGTNVVAVHWNIRLVNREGREGRNSGVTVITIARGKVSCVKDFIFDLGDNFRRNWSAP